MKGYLVRLVPSGRYLEYIPFDHTFGWYAAGQEHASVFTQAAAEAMAALKRETGDVTEVHADYADRVPLFDLDDLDEDAICTRHGKVKPMSEYGVRYGGCSECEPGDEDGEAFRGGEAAGYASDQQLAAMRQKR